MEKKVKVTWSEMKRLKTDRHPDFVYKKNSATTII